MFSTHKIPLVPQVGIEPTLLADAGFKPATSTYSVTVALERDDGLEPSYDCLEGSRTTYVPDPRLRLAASKVFPNGNVCCASIGLTAMRKDNHHSLISARPYRGIPSESVTLRSQVNYAGDCQMKE